MPTKGRRSGVRVLQHVPCHETATSAPRAPLQPIPSVYPNQPLGVDIVGPFPQSKHGNVYLLVFSKWAEAAPLPNQEARTVADAIINH